MPINFNDLVYVLGIFAVYGLGIYAVWLGVHVLESLVKWADNKYQKPRRDKVRAKFDGTKAEMECRYQKALFVDNILHN